MVSQAKIIGHRSDWEALPVLHRGWRQRIPGLRNPRNSARPAATSCAPRVRSIDACLSASQW